MDGQIGQVMIHPDGSQSLLVHFAVRDVLDLSGKEPKRKVTDKWHIACTPNLDEQYMRAMPGRPFPWQRTDDPRAVNCPRCQDTWQFREASVGHITANGMIHFAFCVEPGKWEIACGAKDKTVTDDAHAVTCPSCLESQPLALATEKLASEQVEVIHFMTKVPQEKDWRVECGGKSGGKTDDPRAVTCVHCKISPLYRKRAEEYLSLGSKR